MEVLTREEAAERAEAHRARLAPYVEPHLARRAAGAKHPVHDFLFTYYSYRPAQLMTWHPGVVSASAAHRSLSRSQLLAARAIHRLLVATAGRAGSFGCFGLHEWAMVYRQPESATRHSAWPLRLGPAGTDEVVESHRIACTHFDAYRFFTPPARGLNTLAPGRDDRPEFEQPGCLHANMDLYKHAFRLSPMICSDLVADAFELAWDVRIMDMRAAPYDLSGLDDGAFEPIRIETPEGKREYADAQRAFADRAAPIRSRLIAECERLVPVADA